MALANQLAVRDSNHKGVVWIDNKLTVPAIVNDGFSPTGHRVMFLDYDGFRTVLGKTRAELYRNTRKIQQIKDALGSRGHGRAKVYVSGYFDWKLYDYRAFGRA